MKVLLCLCACIAAASAGIIGYPVAPVTYHSNYVIGHPYTTIARPFGFGYPLAVAPSYVSYNLIPGNVVFPQVVHYLPVVPTTDKDKTDKKMPGKKDEKENKEETTEEPKKAEGEDKTEDLS